MGRCVVGWMGGVVGRGWLSGWVRGWVRGWLGVGGFVGGLVWVVVGGRASRDGYSTTVTMGVFGVLSSVTPGLECSRLECCNLAVHVVNVFLFRNGDVTVEG